MIWAARLFVLWLVGYMIYEPIHYGMQLRAWRVASEYKHCPQCGDLLRVDLCLKCGWSRPPRPRFPVVSFAFLALVLSCVVLILLGYLSLQSVHG